MKKSKSYEVIETSIILMGIFQNQHCLPLSMLPPLPPLPPPHSLMGTKPREMDFSSADSAVEGLYRLLFSLPSIVQRFGRSSALESEEGKVRGRRGERAHHRPRGRGKKKGIEKEREIERARER